jgi:hypothetical protein
MIRNKLLIISQIPYYTYVYNKSTIIYVIDVYIFQVLIRTYLHTWNTEPRVTRI